MSENRMFTDVPMMNLQRSTFALKFDHKTTFNAGKLVPFFFSDLIPGSTVKVNTACVVRMGTTVTAPLDNCAMSIWWFFCPYRLIWDKWKNFNGELEDYWTGSETVYRVPGIRPPYDTGFDEGSVADHFGVPTKISPTASDDSSLISSLPFKAFATIWNEWFRDENLMQKILVQTNSDTLVGAHISSSGNYMNTTARGGDLPPLARPHDLFGSCLPFPQKGDPSYISLMSELVGASGDPIAAVNTQSDLTSAPIVDVSHPELKFGYHGSVAPAVGKYAVAFNAESSSYGTAMTGATTAGNAIGLYPTNLAAELAGVGFTVNELRVSVALQHLMELRARSGSRYRTILNSLYGIEDPNPMLDVPTYLGGKRFQISVTPVVQQSATVDGGTPQGNVAGYSHTGDYDESFTYTNLEGGVLIGCCGVRNEKTYQNGLDRQFRMLDQTDFFNPMFAGLGESAVYNSEIYYQGGSNTAQNNEIFGYMPAFYWQINRPNLVTGQFRSNATDSLSFWHYADNYSALPVLSGSWMADNSAENLDRVLVMNHNEVDQFLADIAVEGSITCCMPAFDVPGMSRI